jgi:hypothetical protein
MAKVFAAFADGWGRVLRAPAILFGVFAVTWLVAFPAGRLMDQSPAASLQGRAASVDDQATGFDRTFTPTLTGADRFVRDARVFVADGTLRVPLAAAAATTLLVWTFLLGGVLDRYARRRPTRTQAFFGASGVFFFRFLRLGAVAAVGYYLLFGVIFRSVFPAPFSFETGDAAAGAGRSTALLMPLYAVFLLAAAFWSAVLDYARIRAVVEDRRSMLGALLAGWRFVTLHPLKSFGLYLLNAASFGALVWAGSLAFNDAGGPPDAGLAAFAAGNAYLLARMALRLVFFASQTAFFQRSLAHAEYTAAPTPLWPESPAAEEIVNAAAARPPLP